MGFLQKFTKWVSDVNTAVNTFMGPKDEDALSIEGGNDQQYKSQELQYQERQEQLNGRLEDSELKKESGPIEMNQTGEGLLNNSYNVNPVPKILPNQQDQGDPPEDEVHH